MKKNVWALLMALFLILALLVGCAGGNGGAAASPSPEESPSPTPSLTATEIWEAITTEVPEENILASAMDLDEETLEALYGITADQLESYVCKVPMMNVHASEVFIAVVKDGEMEAVQAGIESRLHSLDATWSTYLPDQYTLVQDARTVVSGNYILMVVSQEADAVEAAFNTAVGA